MYSLAAYLKRLDFSSVDEESIYDTRAYPFSVPDIFQHIYTEVNNVDVSHDLLRLYKKFGLNYALEWISFKFNLLEEVPIDRIATGCLSVTSCEFNSYTFTKGDEQFRVSLPYEYNRKIIRYSDFIQIGKAFYKLNGEEIQQLKGFTVVGFRLKKYYLCNESQTVSRVCLDVHKFTITAVNEIPLKLSNKPRSRVKMEKQSYTETTITDTRNKRNVKSVLRAHLVMREGLDMVLFTNNYSRIRPCVDGRIGDEYYEHSVVAKNGSYVLFRATPLWGTLALLNTVTGECKHYPVIESPDMHYYLDENGTIYYRGGDGKFMNFSNSSETLIGVPNEIKENLFLITSKYLFCMRLNARFVKIYSRASYTLLGLLQTGSIASVRTYTMTASMYDDTHLRFRNFYFDLNQFNRKRMDIIKDLLPPEILKIIGTFIFF